MHIIHWDGRDRAGRRLSSGVYYVRATIGASAINTRVVLLP
jgi:hypothetical protein